MFIEKGTWAVLSDEQMSNGWPFSLLNDEQMSNWVGVEHQPGIIFWGNAPSPMVFFFWGSGVQGISPVVWLRGFTFTSTLAPEGQDDGPDTRDIFPFVRNGAQWFSQPPHQKKCVSQFFL